MMPKEWKNTIFLQKFSDLMKSIQPTFIDARISKDKVIRPKSRAPAFHIRWGRQANKLEFWKWPLNKWTLPPSVFSNVQNWKKREKMPLKWFVMDRPTERRTKKGLIESRSMRLKSMACFIWTLNRRPKEIVCCLFGLNAEFECAPIKGSIKSRFVYLSLSVAVCLCLSLSVSDCFWLFLSLSVSVSLSLFLMKQVMCSFLTYQKTF